MPIINRSEFTTTEVILQWVKILVPTATAVGIVIGAIISVAIWKTAVDTKLTDLLENQKRQGEKIDWIVQHYGPLPEGLIGPPKTQVVMPFARAETQDSSAGPVHY